MTSKSPVGKGVVCRLRTRGSLVALGAVAALIGAIPHAALAAVGYKTGQFTGHFQGVSGKTRGLVEFRVAAHALTNVSTGRVLARCNNGTVANLEFLGYGRPNHPIPMTDGRIVVRLIASARDYRMTGTLHGGRASGTLRFRAKLDSDGTLDPYSRRICDTGVVRWTARFALSAPLLYRGSISDTNADVWFFASRTRVTGFSTETIRGGCDNGTVGYAYALGSGPLASLPVSRGRFGVDVTNGVGLNISLTGFLGRRHASGQLRFRFHVDDRGTITPQGTVACDTGALAWGARSR